MTDQPHATRSATLTDEALLLFDLNKLAGLLPKRGDYLKIRGLIKQAADVQSAIRDLETSQKILGMLAQLDAPYNGPPRPQQIEVGLTGQSLLTTAVLMYVRATKSESKHRNTLQVAQSYTPELLRLHRKLSELRDNAIAHFGPGPREARYWIDERFIYILGNGRAKFDFPYIRTNYQAWAAEALHTLLPAAISYSAGKYNQYATLLFGMLDDAIAGNNLLACEEMRAMMNQCRFDANSFFAGTGFDYRAELDAQPASTVRSPGAPGI